MKIDFKKFWGIRGKEHEEHLIWTEQFYALGFRKIAKVVVAWMGDLKITPNQITVARFFIFFPLLFYFFSRGTLWGNALGILTYALNGVGDFLDGGLARAKALTSETGAWLDHNFDRFSVYLVLIAIIIGSYRATDNPIFLLAGLLVLGSHALVANIAGDFDIAFGEDLFVDFRFKEAVLNNPQKTFKDQIFLKLFVYNSFITNLLFTFRYPIIIGTVLGILPYIILYWAVALLFRWIFLVWVYLSVIGPGQSKSLFINELKKRRIPANVKT